MAIWLPFRRTSENPCKVKILHTSWPENTRSLGKIEAYPSDIAASVQTSLDFLRRCRFQKDSHRLVEILHGVVIIVPLTCNIQVKTVRNEHVSVWH